MFTKTLQVTAIGTRFSVRRDEQHSSVSVVEGVVTVSVRGSERGFTYTLRAGDAFDLPDERLQGGLASMPVRDGWLAFSNAKVGDLVAEFNRHNAIQIHIESPEIASATIGTGRLRIDSVDSFARVLKANHGLALIRGPNNELTVTSPSSRDGESAQHDALRRE